MFSRMMRWLEFWKTKQPNNKLPVQKKDDEVHGETTEAVRFMIKQPGPFDSYNHCIVTWNRKNSIFYLYENPNPSSASMEKGKFLLAARKFKYCSHIEYVISLDADDFSKESDSYVGKLSSDFLGINFMIYENGSPLGGADPSSHRSSRHRYGCTTKQISPVVANNFRVGQICYKFDELKSKGPRTYVSYIKCPLGVGSGKNKALRNKTPKWHEDLQCLCFELKFNVIPREKGDKVNKMFRENQVFGVKQVEDDHCLLVYRHPLSALQAFAKWISSKENKMHCTLP